MKKNRKGFTLIETLLVSTFVIGTLVYLFVQFSNIKAVYDTSFKRDMIPDLYYVQNINLYLSKTNISTILTSLEQNNYVEIQDCTFTEESYCSHLMEIANVKKAIVVKDDVTALQEELQNATTNPFSETMYQYILNLSTYGLDAIRVIVEFNNGSVASLLM